MIVKEEVHVFLIRGGQTYELPVIDINWNGTKLVSARSLSVNVLSSQKGYFKKTPVDVGDQLVFKTGNIERFRGMITSKTRSSDSNITLIAQDDLQYLTKNRASISFKNKSIDEVVRKLCGDFAIPIGGIATSTAKISRLFSDQTLFDIILTYMNLTYQKTGVKYYIEDVGGKITLTKRMNNLSTWVVENGVNLISYDYDESVDEIATQVKLKGKVVSKVAVPATKTAKATTKEVSKDIEVKAESPSLKSRFGLLQYYEEISDATNQAKLLAQAKQMLVNKGKIKKTFTLEALGISDIKAGSAVYVIIPELGVTQAYYVDADTHAYAGGKHTMSLTLTATDDLPEMDVSSKDETASEKKAAATKNKGKTKTKVKKEAKDDFYEELITEINK